MSSRNLNESINLNNSVLSCTSNKSATSINKKYNLKEKFTLDYNMTKFQDFLNAYTQSKNILLFVDSKNSFWEIVRRNDLDSKGLSTGVEGIMSVTSLTNAGNEFYNCNNTSKLDDLEDSPKSKFYNLEIKDGSMNNSELDISRNMDFNISNFIREIND
jgi:hypothetical protein